MSTSQEATSTRGPWTYERLSAEDGAYGAPTLVPRGQTATATVLPGFAVPVDTVLGPDPFEGD